jgi:transposase InsO family protein
LQSQIPEVARTVRNEALNEQKRQLLRQCPHGELGTLKNELIYHCHYRTREEAIKEITEYIEVFYNRQRRQARLGYLSPAAYERLFYVRQAAA